MADSPLDILSGNPDLAMAESPSKGQFSLNEFSNSGNLAPNVPQEQAGQFSLNDFAVTPYDDGVTKGKSQTLGTMFDHDVLKNVQAVPARDRLLMQLLLDKPEEKAAYMKKFFGDEYTVAVHPKRPSDIAIKRKGAKEWGVVDPAGTDIAELTAEFAENIDNIAQMASIPTGVLAGALTTGGIQGVRQVLRKSLMPELDVQTGKVVTDTIAGGVGGGVAGLMAGAAKKGTRFAVTKTGEIIEGTGNLISKAEKSTGILNTIGQRLQFTKQPKFIAKEIGGTAKDLDPTKTNLLVDKIDDLQKNHPEFMQAYEAPFTIKGKFQKVAQLHEQAGQAIGDFVSQNADAPVQVKDILNSKAFSDLEQAASRRTVRAGKGSVLANRKSTQSFKAVKKDFLENIASVVLGEGESSNSIMQLYRTNKLVDQDIAKEMGAKTNDEALIGIIGDMSMPLGEARALHAGREGLFQYGKQQAQISTKSTVDKYTADAVKDALGKAVQDIPGSQEFLKNNDLYSKLFPVLKTMGAKIGSDAAAIWNPLRTWPGALNSAPRFAAKLGVNLANKTEVRAFVEGLSKGNIPLPPGSIKVGLPDGLKNGMSQILRAGKFNYAKGFLNENAQAETLPRNAEMYFEQPDLLNRLTTETGVDEDTLSTMHNMVRSGNKEGFANALSQITGQHDDLFDAAPYKSLVMNNGNAIIQDPYERESYRDWISKNITDPKERYKAFLALNGDGRMLKSPYEPTAMPTPEAKLPSENGETPSIADMANSTNLSPIGKLADSLRRTTTVKVDDDTERVDYGY